MSIEGFARRKTVEACKGCVLDTDCSHQRKGELCKTAIAERDKQCKAK